MKLTVEDDREAIKRYGHVKPARVSLDRKCPAMCPGSVRTCSLERGHHGPHVAHGSFRRVVAVWEGKLRERKAPDVAERVVRREPRALRRGPPESLLARLWDRVTSLGPTFETVIFLVMFVAFVGFAIHWVLLFTGVL